MILNITDRLDDSVQASSKFSINVHVSEESFSSKINKLGALSFPASSILIDKDVLTSLSSNYTLQLNGKVKIAVDNIEFISPDQYPHLDIYFYENDTQIDYLILRDDTVDRGILRFDKMQMGNLSIPADIPLFLALWERSELRRCKPVDMKRSVNDSVAKIGKGAVDAIAKWRSELHTLHLYPFMLFGTLLGWYRECAVIPHTADLDFVLNASQWRPTLVQELRKLKSAKMRETLGDPVDSFEMKFRVANTAVDLFMGYTSGRRAYAPGMNNAGTKFRWYYQRIDQICSGDLYGHLFHLPCNIEPILEANYGVGWRKDHQTRYFRWDKSSKNNGQAGNFTKEQMKTMHVIFP